MTLPFAAGVLVGWLSLGAALALVIGAAVRIADRMEPACTCDEHDDEPAYVPSEWLL